MSKGLFIAFTNKTPLIVGDKQTIDMREGLCLVV
jgi:hypothetical protein